MNLPHSARPQVLSRSTSIGETAFFGVWSISPIATTTIFRIRSIETGFARPWAPSFVISALVAAEWSCLAFTARVRFEI